MSKIEKYSSYKDSGVEWLGEIPEHWEIKKIKSVLKERKESNKPIKTANILSLCMYRGVIPYAEKGNAGNKAKDDLTAYKLAYPGDIVLNSMNVIAGSVGLSKYFGAVSPVYYMLNSRNKTDNIKFFNQIFQSEGFQKSLRGLGNGILIKQSASTGKLNTIRMRIPMDKLNTVLIPYPPQKEQVDIINFLDKKTALIDEATKQKEELINLLKERRQVLIHNAVTQGLDSTVKMKDSGVEWIGNIPKHWDILPGFKVYKENKFKNTGMIENTVLSLSYGNIVIKPEEKLVGLVPESFETYQIVNPGDIIVRCMDLQNDKTSLRTGIARDKGIITSAYLNLNVFNNVIPEYLHHYLHMLDITKVLYKFGTGLRQNLSYFDFKRLPIVFPKKEEQQKILEYIEINTTRIDTLIKLQEKYINQLKEYKGTFIDSCVTGKVKIS